MWHHVFPFLNKINLSLSLLIEKFAEFGSLGKMLLVFIFSTFLSPFIYGIERFIDGNVSYVVVWAVLLTADSATGIMKHWIAHTFSAQDFFIKATIKTFVSFCGLMVFSAFAFSFSEKSFAEEYLLLFGRIAVSVYVGESALVNMYIITGKKFPPIAFMERLKNFKEQGSFDSFTKKEK